MLSAEARQRLAESQAELVQGLTGRGPLPAGFDQERVRTAAEALVRKRMRSAARACPALHRALGEKFALHFEEYAASAPLPREGGPLADGRAFIHFLAGRGELPDAGRLEALAVDLHHVRCASGLVRRRGPAAGVALLRRPRRLVLAVRLPWLGEWWITLPPWRPFPPSG
jgi:hypothetical protein